MGYNEESSEEEKNNWSQNPNNWVWGIFYYNPEDKRLFPPKRIGLGWTINFGNPNSVFFYIMILLALYIISKYLPRS